MLPPLLLLATVLSLCILQPRAAAPECSWQCDNPIAHAVCTPECQPPVCSVLCNTTNTTSILNETYILCGKPKCVVDCSEADPDTANDTCPTCVVVCEEPHCVYRGTANTTAADFCETQCCAPACAWRCALPDLATLSKPACELQCDEPACLAAPATHPSPLPGHGPRLGGKKKKKRDESDAAAC